MANSNGNRWEFDRHIPVVVIIMLMIQTAGVVWWASNISARVDALESWVADNRRIEARLTSIETQLQGIAARLDRENNYNGGSR